MTTEKFDIPDVQIELKNKTNYFVLLFLLATVFLFSNLWVGDLGLDSCAYATISRSILRTNDWIVPHYEHCKEYSDCWLHPPLFYWMTAVSFKIFGVNEFAARFISALLGVWTILLVYLIGSRTSGSHKIGFLSGFVLLTTHQFLDLSRKCQLDVPLAFFITLSVYLFILALQKNKKYYLLLGLSTGLAILTKGLPALSILIIIFFFFLFTGDLKFFISLKFLVFILSLGLTLCIWVIPLIYSGELNNFLNNYFTNQILTNLVGNESTKVGGIFEKALGYFWYIKTLAKQYWPWLPFLVFSLYMGIKKRKENTLLLIFIFWIIVIIFGFSLGSIKFYRYLAPFYPASAVLIGIIMGEKISKKIFGVILKSSVALLFVMFFVTSIFPIYFGKINAPNKTEIKKLSPYIKSLTKNDQYISVYRINYWGAVADFAFYVDRPVTSHNSENSFAQSLKKDDTYGYIKKDDYNNLSRKFRENYLPVMETENFFVITNRRNLKSLRKNIFPFFIN